MGVNYALSESLRRSALDYFASLQEELIARLTHIDGSSVFQKSEWRREEEGGGRMAVLRGTTLEKAGVNHSAVSGSSYPALEPRFHGKPFTAQGVSTICHPYNPFAPIGHMNLRLLTVGDTFWFGGGADLTPFHPFDEDTREFKEALQFACEHHPCNGQVSFEKFQEECDRYFYIPHRKSVRGVGGIFFDYVEGDFEALFSFIRAVGNAYAEIYPRILNRRIHTPFTPEDRERFLYWRGRYAEYNLIYDRGTKFGLLTGGNVEAIFVSLPPLVRW